MLTDGITVTGESITVQSGGDDADGTIFPGALVADAGATATWDGPVILNDGSGNQGRIGALAAGSLTVSGVISDNGDTDNLSVSTAADGSVTLTNGANTYGGRTLLVRGNLLLGVADALNTSGNLKVGVNGGATATFDMNGFDQTVGGLDSDSGAGTKTITNTSGTGSVLTVNAATDSFAYEDIITGNLSLVKSGAGSLPLPGASDYTGTTTVSEGTLELSGSLTSDMSVATGATLAGEGSTTGSLTFASDSTIVIDKDTTGAFTAGTVDTTAGPVEVVFVSPPTHPESSIRVVSATTYTSGTPENDFYTSIRGTFTQVGNDILFSTLPPADLTWTGTDGSNPTFWNAGDSVNWINGGAGPFFESDTTTFDDTATTFTVDIVDPVVNPGSVTFDNTSNDYTVQGTGAIGGTGSLTKDGTGKVTILTDNTYSGGSTLNDGEVQLGDGTTDPATGTLGSGGVALNDPATLTLDYGANKTFANDLSGDGSLAIVGPGTVSLSGDNSGFDGPIAINNGLTSLGNANALGSATGSTSISAAGEMRSNSAFTIVDGINLSPTDTSTNVLQQGGATTGIYTGVVTLSGDAAISVDGGATIEFQGDLTGSGALIKNESGDLRFTGAKTFTGDLTVEPGNGDTDVFIDNDTSLGTTDGTTTLNGGRAKFDVVDSAETITVGETFVLNKNSTASSVMSVGFEETWNQTGPVTFQTDGSVFVSDNSLLNFTGVIDGTGVVRFTGNGGSTVTLAAANTYTGDTVLASQVTLNVTGSIASDGEVEVGGNATLAGTGSIGSGNALVNLFGTLAPGASAGQLSVDGGFDFEADSQYVWEVANWGDGGTPGTDYDQVSITADFFMFNTPANPLTIVVSPDSIGGTFTETSATYVIADGALPVDGFDATAIVIDDTDFVTATSATGSWAVQLSGDTTAIELVYTAGATDPFVVWAGLGGMGPVTFEGDTNGDGVQDGIAFLLGVANPDNDANGALPAVSEDGSGGLVLTFNCLPTAGRGTAELRIEHSSDLGIVDAWLATVDQVPDADDPTADNGVTFVVDTVSEAPLNKVTATIASSEAADGRLFGRLAATE